MEGLVCGSAGLRGWVNVRINFLGKTAGKFAMSDFKNFDSWSSMEEVKRGGFREFRKNEVIMKFDRTTFNKVLWSSFFIIKIKWIHNILTNEERVCRVLSKKLILLQMIDHFIKLKKRFGTRTLLGGQLTVMNVERRGGTTCEQFRGFIVSRLTEGLKLAHCGNIHHQIILNYVFAFIRQFWVIRVKCFWIAAVRNTTEKWWSFYLSTFIFIKELLIWYCSTNVALC